MDGMNEHGHSLHQSFLEQGKGELQKGIIIGMGGCKHFLTTFKKPFTAFKKKTEKLF